MNLPRLAVRRPITTAMILVSVLVIGVHRLVRLPLAFLPEVDAPFIVHRDPVPELAPRRRSSDEIARPVEEALATLLRRQAAALHLHRRRRPDRARVRLGRRTSTCVRMQGQREARPGASRRCPPDIGHDPDLLVQHRRHPGGRGPDLGRGRGPVRELRAARGAGAQPAPPDPRRGPGRPRRRRAARAVHRPACSTRSRRTTSTSAPWSSASTARPRTWCSAELARAAGCATPCARWAAFATLEEIGELVGRRARAAPARHRRDLATRSRRSTTAATSTATHAIALNVYKESTANTVDVVRAVNRVLRRTSTPTRCWPASTCSCGRTRPSRSPPASTACASPE